MTTEQIPSLFPDAVERSTPPSRGEHGYYRRKTDGWIMTAGAWPANKADMEFKGLEFLPQYGTFTHGTPWGNTNKDRRGVDFNALLEPWRLILQTQGGVAEFPVSQIIAYRWHIRPPYREVKFPQLEGLHIYDLFCPECEKGIFSSQFEQEAIEQLRIHLTCGSNDAHSYRPEDLRALGEEYHLDFFAPRRARNNVRDRRVEAAVETIDLTAPETWECPDCDYVAESARQLAGHKMGAHKASAAPA